VVLLSGPYQAHGANDRGKKRESV